MGLYFSKLMHLHVANGNDRLDVRAGHGFQLLTAVIFPSYSTASSSTIGAIMRHGPHHGAQKSIRTGTLESNTFSLKSVSLTGPAAVSQCPGKISCESVRTLRLAPRSKRLTWLGLRVLSLSRKLQADLPAGLQAMLHGSSCKASAG